MTSQIEKIARLMGIEYVVSGDRVWLQYDTSKREYNPLTNKADLIDVECALGIDIWWYAEDVQAVAPIEPMKLQTSKTVKYADHPDKFTARANAVINVAEQIYDKQYINN